MLITHVVGARPNFMKAAPVLEALTASGCTQRLVHTGQHYDSAMSDLFFTQLGLPEPDTYLGVGSGSHAQQTAAVLTGIESALLAERPAALVVYGDVNSTIGATLAAVKLGIPVAHVEAGLRSFDRAMPEEINRIVTDVLSSYLFTPAIEGDENLIREGVRGKTHRVGNVAIDSLIRLLPLASADQVLANLGLDTSSRYVLVTLHRPATVDVEALMGPLMSALVELADHHPVVFPVHPRTRERISKGAWSKANLHLLDPVGYLEFLALERGAALVITDSGGVQAETTFLGVPCITVRENTEWMVTVTSGTNTLVGRDPDRMLSLARQRLNEPPARRAPPEFWDGHAAKRIASILISEFSR